MEDLISRQQLKETVFDHVVSMSVCTNADERAGMIRMRDAILDDIDNTPAVDAAPVRQGHWIEIEHYSIHGDEYCDCLCEECGHRISRPKGFYPCFCEDCGAQMLIFAKDTDVSTKSQDITNEENKVYDQISN